MSCMIKTRRYYFIVVNFLFMLYIIYFTYKFSNNIYLYFSWDQVGIVSNGVESCGGQKVGN